MTITPPEEEPKTEKKTGIEKWPFLRWVEDRDRWLLDSRTKTGGKRQYFKTKAEAIGARNKVGVTRENEGLAAFDDTELRRFGWSVPKAIEFALDHLRRTEKSKPVNDAVAELLEFKRPRVNRERLSDISTRLNRFSSEHEGQTLAQISSSDVLTFLEKIPHPTTRNDYRKEVVMLWLFAHSRKWVEAPLDKNAVPREKEPEKGRKILTVAESGRLMEASTDPEVCALNALVLFGGIRREEVEKLDWRAVDFKTGHVEVSSEVSKVSRERFAPMPDNLRAWLQPLAKKSGPIVSRTLRRALRDTWKAAKLYPWVQDQHRHSFISYRRRVVGDAETAMDGGTSETIIKKHYKRPVTVEDAKAFFSITPETPANIVSMEEAA